MRTQRPKECVGPRFEYILRRARDVCHGPVLFRAFSQSLDVPDWQQGANLWPLRESRNKLRVKYIDLFYFTFQEHFLGKPGDRASFAEQWRNPVGEFCCSLSLC